MIRIPVALRTRFYRLKYETLLRRARFGSGVRISCRLEIAGPGRVVLGDGVRVEASPWGGDFVTLFTHHPDARIEVGDGATLRGTRVGSQLSIRIGARCVVESASLSDSDFHSVVASERNDPEKIPSRSSEIAEDAYVGLECLCGKGTHLGARARLLPATVIGTRKVQPDETMCGNPPRRIEADAE